MVKSHNGFTLIEVMIVVVIIAILAAIAYPSYQEYIRRTKRVDMQSSMLQIAAQIQKYKIANFTLINASLADLGVATNYPLQGTALYTISLSPLDTNKKLSSNVWILKATPIASGGQKGDGIIALNSKGERCWTKGTDLAGVACVPSSSTNWDGR